MSAKETLTTLIPERSLRERCGIVGLYLPSANRESQVNITLQAIIGLWHRGQQGAGLTIKDHNGLMSHHGTGAPEQAFSSNAVDDLNNGDTPFWIIGQTRYGSTGGWDESNLQPMTSHTSNNEPITVAHNGQFTAIEKMKEEAGEPIPDDASDTYIFSRLLAKAQGSSWDEKIISTLEKVSGAYSLVIGAGDSLYLARDPQGIRPLVLGKIGDGFIAVSETHALDKVGASVIREIKRGEVLRIDRHGLKTIKEGINGPGNFCDFEWDYFSRPDSSYPTDPHDSLSPEHWKSVYAFREECGKELASEIFIPNASFVTGIADSGVPFSLGFANASHIPYRQSVLRDHYDPNGKNRLFQTDFDKESIRQKVIGKLSLVRDPKIWKGAIAVFGDDSIVRGDSSKAITEAAFNEGAKEVHWIVGFPQVNHPCYLGVSMRTNEELIAWRNNGDSKKIAEEIGATSVNYISHRGFIRARLNSGKELLLPSNENEIFLANGGCGGCLTGLYPVDQNGVVYERKGVRPTSV